MNWKWCVTAKNVTMAVSPSRDTAEISVVQTPGFVKILRTSDAYSEFLFKDENANYFIVTIVMVKESNEVAPLWS